MLIVVEFVLLCLMWVLSLLSDLKDKKVKFFRRFKLGFKLIFLEMLVGDLFFYLIVGRKLNVVFVKLVFKIWVVGLNVVGFGLDLFFIVGFWILIVVIMFCWICIWYFIDWFFSS